MGRIIRKSWSTEDGEALLKMKSDRVPGQKIASHFGVTVRAINNKYEQLKNPSAKLRRKDRPGLKGTWRPKPAGSLRDGERWTDEEKQQLLLRSDAHNYFAGIAATLNRSRNACKVQFYMLKRGAASSPGETQARAIKTARERMGRHVAETPANQPEYESLTAAFFRDPLPGRSALDQMRAGIVDQAHGIRGVRAAPPITLATEPMR